ncbi:MAG TPA: hypothetical protein VI297_08560 [Gemmatimonadales bacterium]
MRAPRRGLAVLLAALGVLAMACHQTRGAPPGGADATAADSIVGTVRVVGVEALPRVTLVPDGGGEARTLVGPPALQRVAGLRVAAIGRLAGTELRVERFTVVAANGVPATDGRLVADGAVLYLVTADGERHPLVKPSPNLWAHAGGRVWVSGSLDREPVAYGIIE